MSKRDYSEITVSESDPSELADMKLAYLTAARQRDALLEALKAIRLRVEPGRSHAWTLDDACREVGWVDDECRRAIEAAP